ncbi:MAG: hypothetical protein QW566_06690, partial [Candidatus Jordarchaeales archaeon]
SEQVSLPFFHQGSYSTPTNSLRFPFYFVFPPFLEEVTLFQAFVLSQLAKKTTNKLSWKH